MFDFNFDDIKLQIAFSQFDKDGSGFIDASEVAPLLVSHFHVPESIAEKAAWGVMKMVDDGDGKLSFGEFKACLAKLNLA